tara:strand:+ start:1510 stop:1728 length:219 start_codon:yes stop_codon:yes gene_type:complete
LFKKYKILIMKEQKSKIKINVKKKSKYVGIVLSDNFKKKDKLIPKGSKYDAIDKDSFEYLINKGIIESLIKQ